MYQKALPHFGKPVNVNRNTKCCHKKGNKWFDNGCKKASKDFKSARNTYNRNKTLDNRQRFTKLRTKYNKIKAQSDKQIQDYSAFQTFRQSVFLRFILTLLLFSF